MTIKPAVEKSVLVISDAGENAQLAALLGAEIAARFGPRDEKPLAILARDAAGDLMGGLNGVSHWRWLYVRHLWVAAAHRGQGLGAQLMQAAENEALSRGCIGLYVDTFDERAAAFYRRRGFDSAGRIEDFPQGAARMYLAKKI